MRFNQRRRRWFLKDFHDHEYLGSRSLVDQVNLHRPPSSPSWRTIFVSMEETERASMSPSRSEDDVTYKDSHIPGDSQTHGHTHTRPCVETQTTDTPDPYHKRVSCSNINTHPYTMTLTDTCTHHLLVRFDIRSNINRCNL